MSDTMGANGLPPSLPDYHDLPYGQDKKLQTAAAELPPASGPDGAEPVDPLSVLHENHPARVESRQHAPGDLFAAPDQMQETTAGLPVGPGPGPEVLGAPVMSRVAGVIDALAARTGNPVLASLAAEAAASNL